MSIDEWSRLPDLASRRLGGGVLASSDEFFAEQENLIRPSAPEYRPHTFTNKGQEYDGWETRRRRREPGDHDWVIIRLGVPGIVHTVVVDTAFFTGNYPPFASVEGCAVDGYPAPAELLAASWAPIVPRSPLAGDTKNVFTVDGGGRYTHVRLRIYPDGGVARLRVHGRPAPDRSWWSGMPFDLAALANGGSVERCSNWFYSPPNNMLQPGQSLFMSDGWETARRRDDGHDWAVIRLAAAGRPEVLEIDTTHYKGNAPDEVSVTGIDARQASLDDEGAWRPVLPRTRLRPDTAHRFRVTVPELVTHLRLDVFPDGGIGRFRAYGHPTSGEPETGADTGTVDSPAGRVDSRAPGADSAVGVRQSTATWHQDRTPTTPTARTFDWVDNALVTLDQRRLPHQHRLLRLSTVDELIVAIKELAVRGAPALGIAGAFGVALSAQRHPDNLAQVQADATLLANARPTAVNLAWGVARALTKLADGPAAVLAEAFAILDEDEHVNRAASQRAADLLQQLCPHRPLRVLTHCNTGRLATGAWGTALGAIRHLAARDAIELVVATETRPLLQGARLTAWELAEAGIPYRITVDSAAPALIARGLVDCVVVGADRIAANGDTANKIGTYSLALAAHRTGIPFLVVAPESTVDTTLENGTGIVIEERPAAEVTAQNAPAGADAFNPAFDVTPIELITAVVTELRSLP